MCLSERGRWRLSRPVRIEGADAACRLLRQVMDDVTHLHRSCAAIEECHERDDRHNRQGERQPAGHMRDEHEPDLARPTNRAKHHKAVRKRSDGQPHDALLPGVAQESGNDAWGELARGELNRDQRDGEHDACHSDRG